jgi:hypothetical protein
MYIYILLNENGRPIAASVKKYGLEQKLQDEKKIRPKHIISIYKILRANAKEFGTYGSLVEMPEEYLQELL